MRVLRNLGLGALTVVVACLAAEVFLRLVTEKEAMMATWFTPGVHVPDDRFGFVFKPHYRGYMRHRDGVFGVPLVLNEYGFRRVNARTAPGPRERVVIIGGRSMMFSYGLSDDETIAGRIAAHANHSLEVHSVVWVGFDLYRSWQLYRQKLERGGEWKVAVIGLFKEEPQDFASLPEDLHRMPKPLPTRELFRFAKDLVIRPTGGPLQNWLGRRYYQFYLGYGILSTVDPILARLKTRLVHSEEGSAERSGNRSPMDPRRVGLERFQGLLRTMQTELSAHGTKMLVVFLPGTTLPHHYYNDLEAAVPAGIARLNLQKELARKLVAQRSIASGHYGPEQADQVGARIAEEVDRLLVRRKDEPRPERQRANADGHGR